MTDDQKQIIANIIRNTIDFLHKQEVLLIQLLGSVEMTIDKPHEQTIKVVHDIFGDDLFSFVQGQNEDIPRKPDPTGAFVVAKALGVEPSECLYIGDSDVDMQTGRAAGMNPAGVTWGFRSKEVLQEHGAMYLVDKAEEILEIVKEKE